MEEKSLEEGQRYSGGKEMTNPLITVIIPVYNVEKYLDYCMQSIFSQTYKNLEIILVDDGATDSSGKMCDDYRKADSRVKVIHKENGGLSSARNAGIKVMTGKYLAFVDSDDYVRCDYIERMYSCLLNNKSDMVICSYKKVLGEKKCDEIPENVYKQFNFNTEEIKLKILSRRIPMYAHGKLYSVKLVEKINFPEGKLYEDIPTTWKVIKHVNRVTYITDELYFYRQRENSIVNDKYKSGRMDQLYHSEQILGEIENKTELYYAAISRCFFAAMDNYAIITKEFSNDKQYLEDAIKRYRKGVLKDVNAEKGLKLMAMCSYISLKMVKWAGWQYKKYKMIKSKK